MDTYLRVAQWHLCADEEASPAKGKGGVPARWKEWLDKTKEGGKRKVPNPNPESRKKSPQVSFSTALKDKATFQRAMKEYREWAKRAPEDDEPKEKGIEDDDLDEREPAQEEAPPAKTPKFKTKGTLGATEAEIAEVEKVHAEKFASIYEDMQELEDNYVRTLTAEAKAKYNKLPPEEQNVVMGGHLVGKYFEDEVLTPEEKTIHDAYYDNWRRSSGHPKSQELHGIAQKSGVVGYPTAKEEHDPKVEAFREDGTQNKELQAYARKAYLFQQAFFKHIGLKEMTMHRGIQGQGLDDDPPSEGEDIAVKTRELSSFSTDYGAAKSFGRTVEFRVPVERVFGSYLIRPAIGSNLSKGSYREAEMLVLGASELSGKISSKKIEDLCLSPFTLTKTTRTGSPRRTVRRLVGSSPQNPRPSRRSVKKPLRPTLP